MEGSSSVGKKIGIVVLVLLIIAGIGLYVISMNQPKVSDNSTSISPTTEVETEFNTTASTNKLFDFDTHTIAAPANSPFNLMVTLNSFSKNVTGFDVILRYDPLNVRYEKAELMAQGFDLISHKGTNELTFTVIKKLNVNTNTQFNFDKVLKLTFTSLSDDISSIDLVNDNGTKGKSKIIDDASQTTVQADMPKVKIN